MKHDLSVMQSEVITSDMTLCLRCALKHSSNGENVGGGERNHNWLMLIRAEAGSFVGGSSLHSPFYFCVCLKFLS